MPRLDVRRLAAVDLYGGAGSRLRRWLILTEFVVGAVGCVAIGLWSASDSQSMGRLLLAGWLIGMGANYVPLALHAAALSRSGALHRELAGVDVPAEMRYYTAAQLWVVVPLLLVVQSIRQLRRD